MNAPFNAAQLSAHGIWQGFHWTFFVDVQGLILSLLCFEDAMERADYEQAITEMRCAADLLRASGAAMKLAGSFSAQEYQDEVRVGMMAPNIDLHNFSGLMSWDHARLMRLWQRLSPTLGNLPDALSGAHRHFVDAFVDMIGTHRNVCQHFVGDDVSLRSCDPAVGVLEKLLVNRLRLIDPHQKARSSCPFSGSSAPEEST